MAFLNIAPTGTVLPFAGSTAPEGWAICNGAAINRTTYATLFSVISTTYGTGDGSITFNLPDMQGVFPRGSGTNGTGNYGGATGHTPAGGSPGNKGRQLTRNNGLTASATAPGFTGSSATSGGISNNHTHIQTTVSGVSGAGQPYVWPNIGPYYWSSYGNSGAPTYDNQQGHTHNLTAAGSNSAPGVTIAAGDTETTPAFLALNYIIKL